MIGPMDDAIRWCLSEPRAWAVVGCSPSPFRDSHGIAALLMREGHRVIPVNPEVDEVLGQRAYASVHDIPEPIDVVDVFRRSDAAGQHVDEAIAVNARAVWLQLGVIDHSAAERAAEAGLHVVMDRCPRIELPRLGARGS
jgi:predicted CoA-binding protein